MLNPLPQIATVMNGIEARAADEQILCFEAFGVAIGIRICGLLSVESVRDRLPPGSKSCSPETVGTWFSITPDDCQAFQLRCGSEPIVESADLLSVIDELDWQLRLCVALNVDDLLFVHAGVVGWRDSAIVIPGRTFTGKTTLTAELIRAGATYYSDEYAVFDRDGNVHPYPRPLSVRGKAGQRPQFCTAEQFHADVGAGPLPVGQIVVTSYHADAKWEPTTMTPAEAMMALFENTVAAQTKPDVALSTLRRVVDSGVAITSRRGAARQLVSCLLPK